MDTSMVVPDNFWDAIESLLPKEPPQPNGGRLRVAREVHDFPRLRLGYVLPLPSITNLRAVRATQRPVRCRQRGASHCVGANPRSLRVKWR